MTVERLSLEDARILARERGPVGGHTCKVLVVSREVDAEALRAHLAPRIAAVPRLASRLVEAPLRIAPPAWLPVARLDLAEHVRDGGRAADRAALERIVGMLMAERLDRGRPLWALDVVTLEDSRTALVLRLHHCMADGATAMRMLHALLLDAPEHPPPVGDAGQPPGRAALLADALRWRANEIWQRLRRAPSRDAVGEARERRSALGRARLAALRRELARDGRPSALARPAGRRRTVAFHSCSLDEVKAIAHGAPERATVNDVVLAAVAGGLHRWLAHAGVEEHELRVKVPVSLHHPDETDAANRDSFIVVHLPLDEPDPLARLLAIAAETSERKAAHDADALDAFFHDLGRMSHALERLAARWAMSPRVFALNVSNVPGPRGPHSVMGAPLLELHSLAEIAQQHALRVAVVSAGERLSFGLCADAAAVERLDLVADGIGEELRALAARLPAA